MPDPFLVFVFVLFSLFCGMAWFHDWLQIKEPTKKIVKLVKIGSIEIHDGFYCKQGDEDQVKIEEDSRCYTDFTLYDPVTGKYTWIQHWWNDSFIFVGDLDWMNGTEEKLVGYTVLSIVGARRKEEEKKKEALRDSRNSLRRDKAKKVYEDR
ncbi:hypothetical protein [Salmonella phage SSBI34]|nr:hypothetical protein [Salmonella phage SSBI34]